MLTPVGTFISGVVTSAEATIVLPVVALCLIIAGIYWAFNGHEHGKGRAMAALLGGAVAFMAQPIATALQSGVPH
jgi:hypothetical protein